MAPPEAALPPYVFPPNGLAVDPPNAWLPPIVEGKPDVLPRPPSSMLPPQPGSNCRTTIRAETHAAQRVGIARGMDEAWPNVIVRRNVSAPRNSPLPALPSPPSHRLSSHLLPIARSATPYPRRVMSGRGSEASSWMAIRAQRTSRWSASEPTAMPGQSSACSSSRVITRPARSIKACNSESTFGSTRTSVPP